MAAANDPEVFDNLLNEINQKIEIEDFSYDLFSSLIKSNAIIHKLDNHSKLENLKKIVSKSIQPNSKIRNKINNTWIKYYVHERFDYLVNFYNFNKKIDKINIGIMDYKIIDKDYCSSNLGDYVQTLASVLAWKQALDFDFTNNTKLGKVLNSIFLRKDKDKDKDKDKNKFQLNPVVVDRDSNLLFNAYIEKTWIVCNGWYRHSRFGYDEKSIFADNIIPIFVSFHLNKTDNLTKDLLDYLRKFQPIGCRDWDTVVLLKSHGIESFFSGCLTMTIGDLFNDEINKAQGSKEAFVEVNNLFSSNKNYFKQVGNEIRTIPIEKGILEAFNMLKNYRQFSKIYTSRLHCYLPCTSMNIDIEFIPKNFSDQRFVGLHPLDKNQFDNIRKKLRENLSKIIKYIYENNPSVESFREKWRTLWMKEISIAESHYEKINSNNIKLEIIDKSKINTIKSDVIESIDFKNANEGDYVNIAFAFDQNLQKAFEVTLNSIIENSRSKLRVFLLCRGISTEWKHYIINKYRTINFKFFNMELIDYGDNPHLINNVTVSTMDRLILPDLIDVNKILYLDTDLILLKDVKELFDVDISKNYMAGVKSLYKNWTNILSIIVKKSRELEPEEAKNFRYFCFKNYPNALGKHFNAGVLLLNLDKMRDDNSTNLAFSLVKNYALNDQDILALMSNGNVKEIDQEYNTNPFRGYVKDPFIVHWAGNMKPWNKDNTFYDETYKIYEKKAFEKF